VVAVRNRPLLVVPIVAIALVACSYPNAGRAQADSVEAGYNGPPGAPGAPCDTPGLLYCQPGTGALVLFCGTVTAASVNASTGTFMQVFQCPATEVCSTQEADTAVGCGLSGAAATGTYAVGGGPCATDQSDACSFDATQYLRCEGGVWKVKQTCGGATCAMDSPGTRGCSAPAGTIGCIACH
jgi:hypothetical protein